MKNLYPRVICLAILLFFLAAKQGNAQTITIDNSLLDAGPYGRGSTIAVPVQVNDCFSIGNTFTVYLSNATGSFATETAIGTYAGFFTTFVNGTIPTGQAAGAGYRVRVKSNNPAITSAASNAFTINAVTAGLAATADPLQSTRILSPQLAFGWCSNVQQQTGFVMTNTSTSGSVATATIKNEVNGFTQTGLTYNASNELSLNLERHYYTYINKAVKAGLVSTKAYFIINSPNKLGLSTDGEQQGCLPDTLTFQMGTDTTSGIGNNFPGNRYRIDWGDGTPVENYTQCNIMSQSGLIKHYYVGVSCSRPNITFNVTTTLINPWYNGSGTATQRNCDQPQVVSRAKIFKKPEARFSFPNPACVNVPVTFANNTDPGQAQFGTQCINRADYKWYINGVLVQTNLQATPPPSMTHTFTAVGKYEIKLFVDNGSCETSTWIDSICIEPRPVTNFKINSVDSLVSCAPLNINTTNLTTGSPVCQALGYLWTVVDSAGNVVAPGAAYTISGNTEFEPSLVFLQEGKYKVRLTVTNVCGGIVREKPVVILGTTKVVFPNDTAYCGLQTINFATNTSHKPIYNISLGNETFGWTVTGGSYNYVGGTNANSAIPQIKFNDYATYTITSNFGNMCGTASDVQKISFSEPIATNITSAKYDTLCFNENSVNIAASTAGPADSTRWFSTGTGTFGNKYSTSTTYTLSAADKSAGIVKLYFKIFAKQPSACADLSDTIYLNVIPHNYITSGSPLEICSNKKIGYVTTAFASGSTFNWTSSVQSGTLTGNSASSNGNINDSLINTSSSIDAVIKYTITPTKDGCVGDPFDLLVTVKPLPALNAVAVKDSICADSSAIINLSSSVAGIKYTWTSSMTGGTIIGNSNQAAQTTSAIIKDTLLNAGSTNVTVTYTIKVFGPTGCEGQTKVVNIVVRPKPNTAEAGNDTIVCNNSSLQLNGNVPVNGTGRWTLVSGSAVTFANSNNYNTTVNGLLPNTTYKLEWRITSGGNCTFTKDTITIINRPSVTVANAGADKSICNFNALSPNTTTLSGNIDNTRPFESGVWDLISQPAGGNGGFSSLSNPNATFTFNKVGTYVLVWKLSNDINCTPTTDTMLINVYPKPVAGVTAPTNAITCNGTDVTINLQSYTGVIKKWQYNTNPINDNIWVDTAVTNPVITLSNLQDTILVRCIVSSGGEANGCPSFDTSVYSYIAVNPKTLGGNTNPDAVVCKNDNNGSIGLTGNKGTVQRWEFSINNGSNWNQVNNITATQIYTNLNTNTIYRALVQSGVCPPKYSDTTTITVVDPVTTANAGADQKVCNQTSIVLNGNNAITGTGAWIQTAGAAVTFNNAASPNTTVTGLQGNQVYQFVWKITGLGNCPPSTDTVVVNNRPATTQANAGIDKVICDFTVSTNNATTLNGNVDATRTFETGKWRIVQQPTSSSAYFNDDTKYNALFSFNKSGVYQLEWSIGNDAGCPATKDTITINVFDKPVAGAVGTSPITTCNESTVTASIASYTGIIKKWQYNPKPFNDNIWIDATGTNSTISFNNVQDSFAVRIIVQSNGVAMGCNSEAISDSVVINVTPKTVPGKLIGSTTVCELGNSGTIQLTNYAGNIVKWQNSYDNGVNWIDIANTTPSINYSNAPITLWYRAVVQSGVCPQLYSDTAIITVVKKVSPANAGVDKLLCNQATTALNATLAATGETGFWSQVSGPNTATIVSPNAATSNINGMVGGTYAFQWTLSNNACPATKDTMIIVNRPAITQANAGADKVICDFTLSGNNSTALSSNLDFAKPFEAGKWRIITKPAGSLAYFDNDVSTSALFNFSKAGLYQLEWSISNAASCPVTRDTININVFDKPVVGSVVASPIVSCAGSNVSASLTSFTGTIKKWQYNPKPFDDGIWLDATGTSNSINFNNVQDSFAVRVIVQSDGFAMGCTSIAISDSAIVNVTPKTVPGKLSGSAKVCELGNLGNINLSNYAGNIVKWQQSVDNGVSWVDIYTNSSIISYTNLSLTTWYRAVVQSGVCPTAFSDTAIITVSRAVTKALAGTNKLLCNQPSIQLSGNATATGEIGLWSQLSGPNTASIVSPNLNTTTVNGLTDGTYKFQWSISNTACPATKDSMVVVIRPLVTPAKAGADKVVCDFTPTTNNSITLAANHDATRTFETGKWKILQIPASSLASFDNDTKHDAVFSFNKSGVYKLEWTISNDAGCPPSKDTLLVNVFDKPLVGNVAASPLIACYGSNITASLASYTGSIKKWQYNPKPYDDGIWIDATGTTSTVTLNNMQDSFAVRVIVQSAGFAMGCTSEVASDSVIIHITPKTNPGKTAGNAIVCELSNTGSVTLGNYVGNIVKWQQSTDNGTTWIDIPSATAFIGYSNLTNTTWYRAVVQSGVCPTAFSDTAVVTVTKKVQPAFAGADKQLCAETSTILNANAIGNDETGLWQQISGPSTAIFTTTNSSSTTVNGLITGTYAFEWKLSNNVCPSTKDTVVIVNYPALQNSINTTDIKVCSGQSVTINGATATGGNGTYTYQWQQSTDNINWTNIGSANSINFSFVATDTVYLRRGVESTPCNSISPVVKVMVQKPIANNDISTSQNICINTAPASIIGTIPTGADGIYQYQWQQSNDGGLTWNNISSANQKDYVPSVLTQTMRYRRLVTATLCNGPQASTSSVVTITVNPDAKAQYIPTYQTGCAPFTINNTIITNSLFPNNNGAYDWYVNNNFLGTGNDFPGYTINNANDSVKIKLVAVSKFGCKNDSTVYSFYTRAVPQTAFAVTDTIGCGPLQIGFTNNTPQNAAFQYAWNFGNGQTSNAYSPGNITFTQAFANVDTMYKASLTVFTVCDTIKMEKNIHVQSKPIARFLPDKVTGCSPLTITFTNTSISTLATYYWDFGDGTTMVLNNKNSVQHTFYTGSPTTFNVKLKVQNQCGLDSLVYPIVIQQNAILLNYAIAGDNKGCAPFTVKFTSASIGSTSFTWNFGDGNTLNTIKNVDTIYHTYYNVGDYTVQLKATNGCFDTTAPRTLYVNRKPIAGFSAVPNTTCVGYDVNFTNLTDTATSYVWRFDDGIISNQTSPVHPYAAAGVYNVKLVATRSFNNGGSCVDSTNSTVTIVSKLPGTFTTTDTLGKCTPFVVILTNQNTPSALTTWDFGNNIVDTGNVIVHTFNTVGTYNVKMVATMAGGCKYETTRTIKVVGPSGTFTYDHGYFCGNKPVKFQSNNQNVDSIKWNFGDGTTLVTTSSIVYHTYAQSGKYVPSIELLAGNTCRVPLQGLDTIKVDYIKAGYSVNLQKSCGSTKANFSDTSRSFFGVQQYSWTFGDGATSNQASPVHQYNNTNTWAVQMVIKTNSGCFDTLYNPLYVHVPQKPQAFIQSDTAGCVNEILSFNAVVNSIDTVNYYKWNFTSGYTSSVTLFNTGFPVSGTQTAQLIVGTINGCFDTAYKQVRINPNPFVRTNQDMIICKGQTTPLNATGAQTYIWSPTQSLSCSTCPNTLAAPQTTTQYVVGGFNQFGCVGYDTVLVTVAQTFAIGVNANDTLCIGQSTVLNAQGASHYQWSPANGLSSITASAPTASPTITTKYRVIGTDDYNCFRDTTYVTVAVGQYPVVNIGPDKVQQTGNLMPLKATFTNGPITSWRWGASDFNCTNCAEPIVSIKKDACYYVEAKNMYGCTGRDTMCVKVFFNDGQVFIPNAFTPDGDGKNDVFIVRGKGIKQVKTFRIFNRWGQVVFEKANFPANDAAYGWDGKINGVAAPPDVFVYTCEIIADNDEHYTTKGNVTILK